MNTKILTKIPAMVLANVLLLALLPKPVLAQLPLTLEEAIEKAKTQNQTVAASKQQEAASAAEYQDAKNAILPQWSFGAEYDRFSKLTLFESGLSDAHSHTRRPSPNGVNAGTRAEFTLYSGGRQRTFIEEAGIRTKIEKINTADLQGNVALQTVVQYMEMVRLGKLDSLIGEQIKRAEIRLKNITSLYENQRVTKTDLLRAQVILSANKLNMEQASNDLTIANHRLNVLLNLPDSTRILTRNPGQMPAGNAYATEDMLHQPNNSYLLRRFGENIRLQESRIRLIKSSYLPTVQLVGAYGLNYPNTLFFPPVAQWYSVGFVGIKTGIHLSAFYHSKQKMTAARARLAGMYLQQQAVSDQVGTEISSAQIKYHESLSRIRVAEESIEQTRTNLRITNTKYLNQSALLTDLLDADNLFLESNYNLVRAQADERIFYYKLLYAQGQL
ncbi:TolC family protein [Dyadobacter sp. SG02]|uniref:TolC family protein n=1 Tax=Dyadobacter sp. SG02 TaxID=1855291 RepID=UPI0015A6DAAB|nr:TolC family protein [Dyadobacter sp. SG02]